MANAIPGDYTTPLPDYRLSDNLGESMGSVGKPQMSFKQMQEMQPTTAQGHSMETSNPFLELPSNPMAPKYPRPMTEW